MQKANNTKKRSLPIPDRFKNKVYIRRAELAEVSGLSIDYFERLAWKGEGPPFIKPCGPRGPVLYPAQQAFAWLLNLGDKAVV